MVGEYALSYIIGPVLAGTCTQFAAMGDLDCSACIFMVVWTSIAPPSGELPLGAHFHVHIGGPWNPCRQFAINQERARNSLASILHSSTFMPPGSGIY